MTYFKAKYKYFSVLLVLFLFLGCIFSNPTIVFSMSNSAPTATETELKEALTKCTSDFIAQFINGNFEDFYKAASEQLQQQVSLTKLQQSWSNMVNAIGKPSESISSTYTQQSGLNIVTERLECTLYDINVTISYNADNKPTGLNFILAPKAPSKPQSTDKWKEVAVTVGGKDLPGMLTLPKGVKKPPIVILIQGSGPSDMNESIGAAPNRPFEDIAHGLAERGVATLRYNKRTYQYPGNGGDTIEYEILEDAATAVKMLSNDKRIDVNQIYLLGHSLGGMMAPKITTDNPKIKGFISLAGTLRSLQAIIIDQNEAVINAEASLSKEQKKAYLAQIEAEINKTKTIEDGGTNVIADLPTDYWKSLNAINSIAIVKKLKVPMLILQGGNDFQVYADKDYKLWQTTLMTHKNVTYKLYPGLSHLFMTNQNSVNGAPNVTVYNAPNHYIMHQTM
jgi:dienelactone hydrolase